nr:hypothetical protein [Tanacetum cinerariifolium]
MFEREKVFGSYFNDWFRSLNLVSRVEKKMFVSEQPILPTSVADFEANSGKVDLIQTFHACKQEEGKPVGVYVFKMKDYVEQLERLGYVVPQDLSVGLILKGFTSDFVSFVRNYNMHNMEKTIGELHALLIEYEKGLPNKAATLQVMAIQGGRSHKANKKLQNGKGNGKAKGKGKDKSYIFKPKNPKPSAKENPAKNDACHHCKEHYRFAHISKKCIEKLQHDGLFKSSDDESFDQCVSCLSGKMIRKSFSHCPERATDLLGQIHTDVCRPLRHVSRQGASYFITFIDDYSRYEYLVNISKRRAFWSLNEDILKISILTTNTPYPSRKIRRIHACTHRRPQRKQAQYAVSRENEYVVLKIWMDDPNITMEENTRLEDEKARKHGKVFNWKTAKYGKILYDEDIHDLTSVETEFPAIAFNNEVSSEKTISCKPTASSLNDENDFRISFDDSGDEYYTVVFEKNSFSYKVISTNDLKTDSKNNNEKVMPSLPSPEPTVSCFDDLDFFKDFEKESPAIVYNDALTSKSDFLTEPTLCP